MQSDIAFSNKEVKQNNDMPKFKIIAAINNGCIGGL